MANIAGCISIFSITRHILHLMLENTAELKDRLYPNLICLLLTFVNFTVQQGITTGFLMVAIERHFATIWVNTYEKSHGKFGLLLMLVAVSSFFL